MAPADSNCIKHRTQVRILPLSFEFGSPDRTTKRGTGKLSHAIGIIREPLGCASGAGSPL